VKKLKVLIRRKDGVVQGYRIVPPTRYILSNISSTERFKGKTNLEQYKKQKQRIDDAYQKTSPDVEYVYHATFQSNLKSIMKHGLLREPPQRNWDISGGAIYLCDSPSGAITWYHNRIMMEDKPGHMGKAIILRVKDEDIGQLKYDSWGSAETGDSCFVLLEEDIPPEKIEVYLDKINKWVKLSEAEINL
jgi:hypothetical protein